MSRSAAIRRGAVVRTTALLFLVACSCLGGVSASTGPDELLRQIRAAEIDLGGTVALRNVDIEIGTGLLRVESGVLVPATPMEGRTVEFVFIGQARFRVEPEDAIEAGQLELFTGRETLDTPVEEAVLVVANQQTVTTLLDRPAPLEVRPSLSARAREIHEEWTARVRRRATGVEPAIFKALYDDAAFQDYFALWCRGYELDDFVYQLDPEDDEQLTLASFIPLDVSGWDRRRLKREIRIQQNKGRWLGVQFEDLGAWDVWLSASQASVASTAPAGTGFETEHYEIDVQILKDAMKLRGTARLNLVAEADGRRAATLELFRDLQVDGVTDGEGRELFFFRSGREVVIALPEPSVAGEKLTLDVSYGGRVLKWVGDKIFDLQDTESWHPHCGSVDRATYDVKLSWPRGYDLIASGRRVEGGRGGGYKWERLRLDHESIAFSFVLGKFTVERQQVGHVDLQVAFPKNSSTRPSPEVRAVTVDTIRRSLEYYEKVFGPYPLDDLSVVTLPRRYSQGFLGFVTLTDSILLGSGATAGRNWQRDTTIAHELAHQWWGNLVGWSSYRDQWLSEAMANYSALRYYADIQGEGATFLADMSAGWRESLSRTTADGRPLESLGPIVLGGRLNSSAALNGYRAIVYRKGAVVLAMLARTMGEAAFLDMLRSLAQAAANRVMTTESFLKAMERMSGLELDGFARQYIYGTGIPEVFYDYRVEPDPESGWLVSGEAVRLMRRRYQHAIERDVGGGWDVTRTPIVAEADSPGSLMVPFRLTMDLGGRARGDSATRRDAVRTGGLMLEGARDSFEIRTETRPAELEFDSRGEILARFYASRRHPKLVGFYRGSNRILEGDPHAAEDELLRALAAEPGEPVEVPEVSWLAHRFSAEESQNARIRLALVRLYIGQGRPLDAARQLDQVESLLEGRSEFRMERDVLRSRLEFREGEFAAAYRRLKKTLRIAAPRKGPTNWSSLLWSLQLSSERAAMTEAYALLAVAAYETEHPGTLDWAFQEARDRGVDVSMLEYLLTESLADGR